MAPTYRALNSIAKLHNPTALSLQDQSWEYIELPSQVVEARIGAIFVPLNSNEIAILGGYDIDATYKDLCTFDT